MITGAILAGGRGTRMGGLDKGLVVYQGRPMLESVLEIVAPQVDRMLIIANRNVGRYRRYGHPVHADVVPGFMGPLAGMHAAATHADTDLLLTVPCDVPGLPADLVERLQRALLHEGADACAAHDGKRLHPVICLWRRSLAPSLAQALEHRQLRLGAWLHSCSFVTANFSDHPCCFANMNVPQDLEGGHAR